jgi:hypothetical protein
MQNKRKRVTQKGTVIKNEDEQEHELCIMARIGEASFNCINSAFLVKDLLEEKIFQKSECFLKSEFDEIDALDEMQEQLFIFHHVLQDILKRFVRFHHYKAESDQCKCFESDEFDEDIYFQCPECRMLDEEFE